jgi:outer membrane lipoprotein carrier protein
MHATKREYRISNKEYRMMKIYGRGEYFIIRNSMFDIRYSFREHVKLILLELPTAEELAKHLRRLFTAHCPLPSAICLLLFSIAAYPQDPATAVAGLQQRYASAETVSGTFQQTYRGPGMDQTESGVFWMKRPGLMRWEYRSSEGQSFKQLFIADGREASLYVPEDHQVTKHPFNAADVHNTPLEFLLGAKDIDKNFSVSTETEFKSKANHTVMIRLTPRTNNTSYRFLAIELDRSTFDVRRIVLREPTGNTMEFLLSNVAINVKIDKKQFQFTTPKGVEIIRLNE